MSDFLVILSPCLAPHLCPFATSQPHSLTVLLQLGNELITLADNILVLLVLVVWTVCLDDAFSSYAVDGAGDSTGGDEAGEVTRLSVLVSDITSQ